MLRPRHKALLEAVERSGRSARDGSLAAVGRERAVRTACAAVSTCACQPSRTCAASLASVPYRLASKRRALSRTSESMGLRRRVVPHAHPPGPISMQSPGS